MSASYPGAVKTFATRSAGQTIASAIINDLQDEVNAIEAGLLNGSAPLNSSKSTVAALSVTGGSTFAAVQFAGPITLTSTTTINAGGSIGTAGQVLASAGAAGVVWQSFSGITSYTPTLSTIANSASSAAVLSFEVSSGAWTVGQTIKIAAAATVDMTGGSTRTIVYQLRAGSNKIALSNAVSYSAAGPFNHLLHFEMMRVSTSIWVRGQNSSNLVGELEFPFENFLSAGAGFVRVLSGVDFASSNTVALVVTLGAANAAQTFGVQQANVIKA